MNNLQLIFLVLCTNTVIFACYSLQEEHFTVTDGPGLFKMLLCILSPEKTYWRKRGNHTLNTLYFNKQTVELLDWYHTIIISGVTKHWNIVQNVVIFIMENNNSINYGIWCILLFSATTTQSSIFIFTYSYINQSLVVSTRPSVLEKFCHPDVSLVLLKRWQIILAIFLLPASTDHPDRSPPSISSFIRPALNWVIHI